MLSPREERSSPSGHLFERPRTKSKRSQDKSPVAISVQPDGNPAIMELTNQELVAKSALARVDRGAKVRTTSEAGRASWWAVFT